MCYQNRTTSKATDTFSPAYSSIDGVVTTPFGTVAFNPSGLHRAEFTGPIDIALVRTNANTQHRSEGYSGNCGIS